MAAQYDSLKGKRVLITGSSRGIGRALALAFAQNGADVALHGARHGEALEEARVLVSAYGVRTLSLVGDLGEPSVPARLVAETVEGFGGIDILICNASIQIRKPWLEVNEEDMRLQTETNLFSTIRLLQQAVPYMQKNGWGRIITIGSTQQCKPHPEMLVYAAIKSAVRNIVQSLAMQLAPENITVNNVAVGTIYTDRNTRVLQDEAYHRRVKNDIPVRFIGLPEDCTAGVLLLSSDEGRYITGEDLHVDGGKFM